MSRRLSALLAAAKLADRDVDLARAGAQRDSQNFASVTEALKSLVPAAGNAIEGYGKMQADEAMQGADQLVAENANAPGDASESPEAAAKRLAFGDKRIAAPEKSGDAIKDFLADPFGYKARAAKAAQTAAEAKLAGGIRGAREKEETKQKADAALEYAHSQDAQKREDTLNEQEAQRAAAEQARMDALAQRGDAAGLAYDTAEKERAKDLQIEQMKLDAKKSGGPNPMQQKRERLLDLQIKQLEDKPKGTPATSEDVDKLATLDDSLSSIANIKQQMQETPTGIGAAVNAFVGRQPLVGDLVDPGAKSRQLYDALESFKAAELKRLSGSGVTTGERQAFDKFNASISSSPSTALAALAEYERAVKASKAHKITLMRDLRNVDVSKLQDAAGATGDAGGAMSAEEFAP